VQAIAVHTGHVMGLSRRDLQELFWGAVLHDIGKIGIPDVILCKPGKLTEDEYAFIKTHPQQSHEILRHIDYVTENALLGVRHHHERFDGAGYPDRLRGAEIPLHARIISVSDCYDAITSSRSYRSDRGHAAALTEIQRVAGSQLDPDVVAAFEQACGGDMMWLDGLRFQHDRSNE
jgi:HD-GYP domain-containing protein (c-di-GMP phosphodiesterase class II)